MVFIARCGFFVLSLLVIFAFFEVRYDAIRRRDNGDVSVKYQPTVNVLACRSGVSPCVLP